VYIRERKSVTLGYVRGALLTSRGLLPVVSYKEAPISISSDKQESILCRKRTTPVI
jgi:hypothetical protein